MRCFSLRLRLYKKISEGLPENRTSPISLKNEITPISGCFYHLVLYVLVMSVTVVRKATCKTMLYTVRTDSGP